ncbi:MAG TPA: HU family DNA-binding protein [Candidatus Sulfotelmatobacter sp.]|nr:HU family DNA-binding protein [Candidatus Sulfotelmatobacter sp.]
MRLGIPGMGCLAHRSFRIFAADQIFSGNRRKNHEEGPMTKADLIDEVSRLAELTRKDSEVIVETIFDSVVRSLRAGDKIEIRGFGSFRTRQRKPRVGRNPKTGERVEVPAKKIPFFKPSKELKDLVNESHAAPPATAATPAPPTTSTPPTA